MRGIDISHLRPIFKLNNLLFLMYILQTIIQTYLHVRRFLFFYGKSRSPIRKPFR